MNNDKQIITNDQIRIPWYFGRKFWGSLTGLPLLLSFLFYWHNTYDPFWEKLINYFLILSAGGIYLVSLGTSPMISRFINGYIIIILYYIILGLFVYLGFRKQKVKIIFPILIIIIIIISAFGLATSLFLREN